MNKEIRYITDTFGLAADMPTWEYPDGFRIQGPMRDASEYLAQGCRLVPRNEIHPVRTVGHTFWDACSTEPA